MTISHSRRRAALFLLLCSCVLSLFVVAFFDRFERLVCGHCGFSKPISFE